MKRIMTFFLIILISSTFANGKDFHTMIQDIYGGFIAHQVSDENYNNKMKELDSFWKMVQSDTLTYLPELQKELQREDNPNYFYWDGACLLYMTSKSESNISIIIKALKIVDIKDVNTDVYFSIVRKYAFKNIDISDLAIKILDRENFEAIITNHAFKIDKSYCFYYLLIPLTPSNYVNKLIDKYSKENNINNKGIILKMLWHTNTCIANEFLTRISNDNTLDNELKNLLNELKIDKIGDKIIDKKYKKAIERRKEVYSYITDYTIKEIDELTKTIRNYNCL